MLQRRSITLFIVMATAVIIFVTLGFSQSIGHWDREPGYTYPDHTKYYTPEQFKPRQYVVYRTIDDIHVDGKFSETSWENADWTDKFVHIMFEGYRNPTLSTRAKMVWNDENLYFAGKLEDPNIYGHLTKKDTVICLESDFEIFIDVDDDSKNYIEIEFNALGTIWDMTYEKLLDKGALPTSWPWISESEPWDVEGMRLAVRTDGTLNYHFDEDEGWQFECSIPWRTLEKQNLSAEKLNQRGSMMRINFSRVQMWLNPHWPIVDWSRINSVDWLWSPMLIYRAHVPETFGRVILSDKTVIQPKDRELENAYPFVDPPKPPKRPKVGSMVKIKGGTYAIGPDDDPTGASPRGEVTVEDFYIDRYEVTIGQYVDFLNSGGKDEYYWEDMRDPNLCGIVKLGEGRYVAARGKELYPVVLLKLAGAKAYAAWAGKRLPTEYEWEIAARGTSERTYPWGNEPLDTTRANYDYHVGHTVPVGSYPKGRTPEGVYDMAGNVTEMIDVIWEEYPWGKQQYFEGRLACPIIRGGAWTGQLLKLASTFRDVVKTTDKLTAFVGFRCARDGQ